MPKGCSLWKNFFQGVASLRDAVTELCPRRPTLRSFVAYMGLIALRASCLFEAA